MFKTGDLCNEKLAFICTNRVFDDVKFWFIKQLDLITPYMPMSHPNRLFGYLKKNVHNMMKNFIFITYLM